LGEWKYLLIYFVIPWVITSLAGYLEETQHYVNIKFTRQILVCTPDTTFNRTAVGRLVSDSKYAGGQT